MTDSRCEAVRVSLDLGETDGVAEHLAGCETCRAAAARMDRLTTLLLADARIEPPRGLDARVRSLLAPEPFGVLERPWLAGGLAVASFAALVATLAVVFSYTSAAEYGPLLALAVGSGYLALSAAAALPLMMHGVNRGARPTEVRA